MQGSRTDLVAIKDMISSGASLRDVADEYFTDFVRYHKGIEKYVGLCAQPRNGVAPEILFFLGPTGCGKSYRAFDLCKDCSYYVKPAGKWWDGYNGQHTVIFDEWYGHCYPYTELLRLLDRYVYPIEVKGGSTHILSSTVRFIFTSNQHPKDWYEGVRTHQVNWSSNPLRRRLSEFGTLFYLAGRDSEPVNIVDIDADLPVVVSPRTSRLNLVGVSRSVFLRPETPIIDLTLESAPEPVRQRVRVDDSVIDLESDNFSPYFDFGCN